MIIQIADFNASEKVIPTLFDTQWAQLERLLKRLPLYVKASDQAGIQGNLIFDPVGTNESIKNQIGKLTGWQRNLLIPPEFSFLGTDVDFVSGGLLVEVQFSNYPFLLNNTIRAELFYKSKALFAGMPIEAAVIVTKAKMFPASNSTLYFEQARSQLEALIKNKVFDVPIRLVGLFERVGGSIPTVYTTYTSSRYSRTVASRQKVRCRILAGASPRSRCSLMLQR